MNRLETCLDYQEGLERFERVINVPRLASCPDLNARPIEERTHHSTLFDDIGFSLK